MEGPGKRRRDGCSFFFPVATPMRPNRPGLGIVVSGSVVGGSVCRRFCWRRFLVAQRRGGRDGAKRWRRTVTAPMVVCECRLTRLGCAQRQRVLVELDVAHSSRRAEKRPNFGATKPEMQKS